MRNGEKTRFKKGIIPWNKEKKGLQISWNKGNKGLQLYHDITGLKPGWNKGLKMPQLSKENHPMWIKDRTKVIRHNRKHHDSEYKQWHMNILLRDGFKCRINNQSCNGKIITHHIFGWSLYPELRYEVNNGITLCHAHHPRKRAEEKRLIPEFQELVSVVR